MAVNVNQVGENNPPTTVCGWPINLFAPTVDIRGALIDRLRRMSVLFHGIVDYLDENTFRIDTTQTEVIDAQPTSSTRDDVEITIENDDSDSEVIDLSHLFEVPLDHPTLVTFNDYPEFFSPPGTPVSEVEIEEQEPVMINRNPNPVADEPIIIEEEEEEGSRCPRGCDPLVCFVMILVAGLAISPFLI
ncbi:uncharacterized protein LOC111051134 [Nilaparvata lugens]|uniref:uncharacterized protein LOC111051134 n=1 Tax=Nilaparvata lugens TaxID=108931 RepID=UPI000B998D22|nr:uncharacterized protein LOC111051134 [Nilaparvata lugens]XP_022193255.1 uncharacterized protein LOC111051134 [Nilaparvata lugens]